MNYISMILLIVTSFSCKNEKKNDLLNFKKESELKSDTISESFNELAYPSNDRINAISKYNTDNPEIENINRPKKTIIRNLEIDTSQAFGIWAQDPNGSHADFRLSKKYFLVVDYDGDGHMPYILDKNKITVFFNDFEYNGIINFTKNDTLKIKWNDADIESIYVKFKN